MSDNELQDLGKLKFKRVKRNKRQKKSVVRLDFSDSENDEEKEVKSLSKKTKLQHIAEKEALKKQKKQDNARSFATNDARIERSKAESDHSNFKQLHQGSSNDIEADEDGESDINNDREWYAGEENGYVHGDESHNPFGLENEVYDQEKEAKLKASAVKRISYERKAKHEANDLWESNRMVTSGAMRRERIEMDFQSDLNDTINEITVHYNTPSFLKSSSEKIGVLANTRKGPISPFRDPESDMAVFARKGSSLVRERLSVQERKKSAKAATTTTGTVLSNVMGIKDEESDDNEVPETSSNAKFIESLGKVEEKDAQASDFASKLSIKEQRKFLPAYTVRDQLLQTIDENQLVVVIGETGSGKTTQLTQFLYEHGYGKHGMIGCTQPRRVAAMSVAKRVSEEMECRLGTKVGFSIRFEDLTSEETVIRYMTDGILLKETLSDPLLNKYSCIIIDEAHERTLNTDILLGLFKGILAKRMDLKIIITSATMNADKFSSYYINAPQFTIPGRTFPVDILYSRTVPEDYIEQCVKTCVTIHLTRGPGDILVFLTGKMDIDTCCDVLSERLEDLKSKQDDKNGVGLIPNYEILPIYSQMPADLQAKVFNRTAKGTRKVVVATNIAETSLTIDNIKYVVDSGYYKIKIFNSKMGMDTLQMAPISLANANQRSGRAGRTAPGVAYRLYTESAARYDLYPETIPEIQRTNLSNTCLMLKSLNVSNVSRFPFLDPPPEDSITSSLYELWAMKALDDQGELTSLGRKMVKFPMDPSLSKLLINSVELQCVDEMVTIVSMLSVPNVFYRPKERQDEADAAREKFFVPESDHLTLLNVYSQWKNNKFSSKWAIKHFLHSKSLFRARDIRQQLVQIMNQQFPKAKSGADWDSIRKCICSGFFHQACKLKGFGKYASLKTGLELFLHPTSALYGLGDLPKYVVYHELILTTKEYMSYVTESDPHWLAEYGEAFYTLKTEKVGKLGTGTIWDT